MGVRFGLWRKLSAEELMLLNCGVGEDSWESLGLQGDPTSPSWRRSVQGVHWKDGCWSWNSNTLAHTHTHTHTHFSTGQRYLKESNNPNSVFIRFSHGVFATPWTAAHQASLSIEFSRQEYWSELPCPPPGVFPTQGWNPGFPPCRWILYRLSHERSPECKYPSPNSSLLNQFLQGQDPAICWTVWFMLLRWRKLILRK